MRWTFGHRFPGFLLHRPSQGIGSTGWNRETHGSDSTFRRHPALLALAERLIDIDYHPSGSPWWFDQVTFALLAHHKLAKYRESWVKRDTGSNGSYRQLLPIHLATRTDWERDKGSAFLPFSFPVLAKANE